MERLVCMGYRVRKWREGGGERRRGGSEHSG